MSRRKYTIEFKRQLVDAYLSGKSIDELGREHNIHPQMIYKWKSELEERIRSGRVKELESVGLPGHIARKIQELEEQNQEFQRKIGEQAVMIDLLKKLRQSKNSASESDVSGLSDIMKEWARSRRHAK